jgi:hypothetical protein
MMNAAAGFILASVGLVHAEIGDTLTQAIARYGQPVKQYQLFDGIEFIFVKDGLGVTLHFGAGSTADYIGYFKTDLKGGLSNEEIERCLKANGVFTEFPAPSKEQRTWVAGNNVLLAVYGPNPHSGPSLEISTAEMIQKRFQQMMLKGSDKP